MWRAILILGIFWTTASAGEDDPEYQNALDALHAEECLLLNTSIVVQALGNNEYEVHNRSAFWIKPSTREGYIPVNTRYILQTNLSDIKGPGNLPGGTAGKYKETRKMKLANGFTSEVFVMEETTKCHKLAAAYITIVQKYVFGSFRK